MNTIGSWIRCVLALVFLAGWQVAVQAQRYTGPGCGDDLSRENVMKVATSMKDVEFPMLFPGVTLNTSPTDFYPIRQFVMNRFNGKDWVPFTDPIAKE